MNPVKLLGFTGPLGRPRRRRDKPTDARVWESRHDDADPAGAGINRQPLGTMQLLP